MESKIWLSYFLTMMISTILVPLVKYIALKLDVIAKVNERTVHTGRIARMGGLAIYLSFLAGATIFLKTDQQINAILIGGFLIFVMGLYDDMMDLSPKQKIVIQLAAALILIFLGGVRLRGLKVAFFSQNGNKLLSWLITIVWVIGITNAINLIDGLDGLCAGISMIVLISISMTSSLSGRSDIASLSFVLAGAIMGFLFYNFHPASIFMGDGGSQFIGFMISAIALLGFGYESTAFFTLGAPIVVLMVPIMDTLIAIILRKVHHHKFSEADKKHLHHSLMFTLKLGQRKSVIILYIATGLFSLSSYLYEFNTTAGIVLFMILLFIFEIFVEYSEMIDRKYKPVLTILNIFIRSDRLPKMRSNKKK